MDWLKHLLHIDKRLDPLTEEQQQLIRDVREAHKDWVVAQERLDFVIEKDQIDYAIYILEAAEKRYEMLLRHAKQMKISAAGLVETKGREI